MSDYRNPKEKTKGKFKIDLFRIESQPYREGDEILGPKKNLSNYVRNSFCGLANLQIATGIQGKVLTYMSYGLPVVCSKRVAQNFGNNVLEYKKNSDLIEKLISLKKDK